MRHLTRPFALLLAAACLFAGCEDPAGPDPDTAAPSVQLAAPAPGTTVTTEAVAVAGTAADDEGVVRVAVQVNGGAETEMQVTAGTSVAFSTTVPLAVGQNTLAVHAYDEAGNRGTATVQVTRQAPAPPPPTPELLGLTIDPDSVDVRSFPSSVQFTFRVSRAFEVSSVVVRLTSASGGMLGCESPAPVSTDAGGVGTFRCNATVPTSALPGPYTVSSVTLGQKVYTNSQLQQPGFETHLGVAAHSAEDQRPPMVTGLTFSPDPVQLTGASATVSFTVRATDPTGVSGLYVLLYSSDGQEVGRCTAQAPGNPAEATMQCAIAIRNSPFLQPGTLQVWLGLLDARGRYGLYNAAALAAAGFDSALELQVDTSPPALMGLDLAPDSIDVRTTAAGVEVTFRVSNGYRATGVQVTLGNEGGNSFSCTASTPISVDASGVALFRCSFLFQRGAPPGPYTVTQAVVSGTAYGTAALQAAGYDTVLKVTSNTIADTTPPAVAGLAFSPDPVQVTGRSATVTFTVRLTDAGAGAGAAYIFLVNSAGNEVGRCATSTLVSGTPADGTFQCTITFTNNAALEPATYGVAVRADDRNGNFAIYQPATLQAAGFDASLELQVDTSTPTLKSFSFAPDSVDVRTQNTSVEFTFVVNNGYRASSVQVTLRNEGGEILSCESHGSTSTDAAGVPVFRCSTFVGTGRGAGTYTVVSVRTGTGNYGTAELQAAGFPTQLKVVSNTVSDVNAPEVVSLSFSPDPVHLSGGDQLVTFSGRFTDASGTGTVIFFLVAPNGTSEYGRCTATAPVSGTRTDGTFQCTILVRSAATTPQGTYRVAVGPSDVRGSYRFYNAEMLAAQGLDTTLEVQP